MTFPVKLEVASKNSPAWTTAFMPFARYLLNKTYVKS